MCHMCVICVQFSVCLMVVLAALTCEAVGKELDRESARTATRMPRLAFLPSFHFLSADFDNLAAFVYHYCHV